MLTEANPISRSQIFPFWYYAGELARTRGIEFREVNIDHFIANPENSPCNADIVLIQPWFTKGIEAVLELLSTVRQRNPSAKLVFLDAFAPTDLRWAEHLDGQVDLYVKKHVFRDRQDYGKEVIGDTNLMDYYCRRYGFEYPLMKFNVPASFFRKLLVGPSFFTADYMLPVLSEKPALPLYEKPRDVLGRLSYKGSDWYQAMRKEAIEAMSNMAGISALPEAGVDRKSFLKELLHSKICFSPFGYGEVSWRDYESVMSGSLLIKPDMSHIETNPDIFIANKTYVPINWDFSDFREKVDYYLRKPHERNRIVNNAYSVLADYTRNKRFIGQMDCIFQN
ncbi:MAG: glycosyltransferase [Bacteroidota bacterium]